MHVIVRASIPTLGNVLSVRVCFDQPDLVSSPLCVVLKSHGDVRETFAHAEHLTCNLLKTVLHNDQEWSTDWKFDETHLKNVPDPTAKGLFLSAQFVTAFHAGKPFAAEFLQEVVHVSAKGAKIWISARTQSEQRKPWKKSTKQD